MNKINVLNIVNTHNWSWGIAQQTLLKILSDEFNFVHGRRLPGFELTINKNIPGQDLIDYFPVTLIQNVDTLPLIKSNKHKVICRMGGMMITNDLKANRYDKELKKCGMVIATNHHLMGIAKRSTDKVKLCPNGIDLDKFRPPDKPLDDEPFTIGFAGNVYGEGMDYKGYGEYVQASLRLTAEGVQRKNCLHGVNQYNHDDMPEKFYHQIHCLILPSKDEGCSNVTGEAMACGVPVISTKVGYHGEMCKDKENILFIEKDTDDIINKVLMLRADRELWKRISVNSRKFVEEHQNIKQVADVYKQAILQTLNLSRMA